MLPFIKELGTFGVGNTMMFIHGENDKMIPVERIRDGVNELCLSGVTASLICVEDASHLLDYKLNDVAINYIKSIL